MDIIKEARIIPLASVGICEHCQALITIIDLPSMNAEWHCPKCNGILSRKSFGYEKEAKQTKWVGPDGQWTTTQPTESFHFGNWKIIPRISVFSRPPLIID